MEMKHDFVTSANAALLDLCIHFPDYDKLVFIMNPNDQPLCIHLVHTENI